MAIHRIGPDYQVRVARVGTRFFAARKHGGAAAALRLAKQAEREMLAQQPPLPPRIERPLAHNTSGVNGIRFVQQRLRSGRTTLAVQVSWCAAGKPCGTAYSTKAHGLLGAVELAILARERGTGEPFGLTPRQVLARLRKEPHHG